MKPLTSLNTMGIIFLYGNLDLTPSVKESWAPRKWMTEKLRRRLSAHCQLSTDILCLPGVMYRLEVRLYYHLHLFLCKRKERMPNGHQHQHKQAVSTTSLPFRSNSTMRPLLVEDPSRHIKIIARIMELVINGLIKKPSRSTQMVRPIATKPVIKGEAGLVTVVVVEAMKYIRSIIKEAEVFNLNTVRIVTWTIT